MTSRRPAVRTGSHTWDGTTSLPVVSTGLESPAPAAQTVARPAAATTLAMASRGGPLWLQVVEYAREHADPEGVVVLEPWQLRRALDPFMIMDPSQFSRAIRTAEQRGYLDPSSTARRLVLT